MATNLVAKLQIDGVYTTYPLFEAEGVEIQVGPDFDLQLDPSSCKCTWQNPALDLDPSNPTSPLYGKIGRNTKMRLDLGSTPLTVFAGEIATWEPDETQNATSTLGRRWVSTEAAGVSRRLGKWEDPLDSPMTRQNSSIAGLLGFWPLEGGGTDTTQLSEASGVAGAAAGSVTKGMTFGGDPGPGGADGAVTLGSGGAMAARFARVTTSGYQVVFHAKLKAVPTSTTYLEMFGCNLSNGNRLQWMISSSGYLIQVIDPTGAVKGSFASSFGTGVDPTAWIRYRVKSTISAGTVTVEPAWYPQDAAVIYGVTFTYADSGTGALLNWQVSDNAWTDGGAYAQILATSSTAVDLTGDYGFVAGFNGYLGEAAAERAYRIMLEQGETLSIIGNMADTPAMGRQKPDTIMNILEQCRATDGGLLYDFPTSGLITFRTRQSMINQTAALALTKSTTVAYPLKPVIGDQLIVNDVTVNNLSGASTRVVTTTGRLSIQAPPAGAGRYKKRLDVNFANDLALYDRGSWERSVGTTDRRWYKQVPIDLLDNPSLINPVIQLRPGDLITLAGAEPDTVGLIFLRALWSITNGPIKVTLLCVPADGYQIGVYDATSSRYDASFSTLAVAATAGQATLSVTNPVLADCWSTTATPYDITCEGERMTVTAATAPAGTGPYTQTLTVTRAVNGVSKAHTTVGASINLADPRRYL